MIDNVGDECSGELAVSFYHDFNLGLETLEKMY